MARKKAVTQASTETLEPRVYELGFLLSPAVREEDLDARVNEIKDIITNAGGTFISEGAPEFIDLAYEMSKTIENKHIRFNQGYFDWVKFTVLPNQIAQVLAAVEKHILVIRALIISTIAENTIISKKPLSKILKPTDREEIIEEDLLEGDDEIDLGIAAVELQTPVNDESDELEDVNDLVESTSNTAKAE